MSATTAPLSPPPQADRVSRRWLAFWAVVVTAAYALLWSPWWYPLSDSSLYLSLARSLATGRGFTYMGAAHNLVPAATPMLLAGIIKIGGGIGAMQVVLTALMLVSHLLCFLVLRRWVGERLALAATLAGAFSYWVFINAFTIMSEPLCLTALWLGMGCLTRAAGRGLGVGRRWAWVTAGALLLLGSADNRIAAAFLVPGALLALLLYTGDGRRVPIVGWVGRPIVWVFNKILPPLPERDLARAVPLRHRVGWAALFFGVFAAFAVGHFMPEKATRLWARWTGHTSTTQPTTVPTETGLLNALAVESGQDTNGQYKSHFLPNIARTAKGLLFDFPVFGGRWICEGLAMPTVKIFQDFRVPGSALALAALAVACVGSVQLLRRRQWWIVGLGLYYFIFWVQWGDRIKPRYMTPIVPLLLMNLWTGLLTIGGWIKGRRISGYEATPGGAVAALAYATDGVKRAGGVVADPFLSPAPLSRPGRMLAGVLLACVIVANAPAWAMEFYIRHVTDREFYTVARRGAFGDLVDIAAFLHSPQAKPGSVAISLGAHRRIAYLLTGRKIVDFQQDIHTWSPTDDDSRRSERKFLAALSPRISARAGIPSRPRVEAGPGAASHATTAPTLPRDPNIEYAIVEVDKTPAWPEWHWPLPPREGGATRERWFQLYRRVGLDRFEPFDPPHSDGTFAQYLPPSGL